MALAVVVVRAPLVGDGLHAAVEGDGELFFFLGVVVVVVVRLVNPSSQSIVDPTPHHTALHERSTQTDRETGRQTGRQADRQTLARAIPETDSRARAR